MGGLITRLIVARVGRIQVQDILQLVYDESKLSSGYHQIAANCSIWGKMRTVWFPDGE